MRIRIAAVAITAITVAVAAVWYYSRRTAGYDQMQSATERIAGAVARSDREALAAEPLLQGREETISWFLQSNPDFANGYRVTVGRNGMGGFTLMSPEILTHLGVIETPSRHTLALGFRYDRSTNRLEFVTASRTSFR